MAELSLSEKLLLFADSTEDYGASVYRPLLRDAAAELAAASELVMFHEAGLKHQRKRADRFQRGAEELSTSLVVAQRLANEREEMLVETTHALRGLIHALFVLDLSDKWTLDNAVLGEVIACTRSVEVWRELDEAYEHAAGVLSEEEASTGAIVVEPEPEQSSERPGVTGVLFDVQVYGKSGGVMRVWREAANDSETAQDFADRLLREVGDDSLIGTVGVWATDRRSGAAQAHVKRDLA